MKLIDELKNLTDISDDAIGQWDDATTVAYMIEEDGIDERRDC